MWLCAMIRIAQDINRNHIDTINSISLIRLSLVLGLPLFSLKLLATIVELSLIYGKKDVALSNTNL
jgi:hypothetical protein